MKKIGDVDNFLTLREMRTGSHFIDIDKWGNIKGSSLLLTFAGEIKSQSHFSPKLF